MLPFKNRLKKKKDFEKVFSSNLFFSSNLILVKQKENEKQEIRIGFVVSKKISKKAVERNKIKRILRDQTRHMLDQLKKGTDIVVIARKPLLFASFKEVENDLKNVFLRLGVIE
jgi:ribonuclease P protein component